MKSALERILYAEDDPEIQTIARLALEIVGEFSLLVCDNGRVALDMIDQFAPPTATA